MQALLTLGSSRICWTPALDCWVNAGCRRDAMMKLGWPSGSLGSGGMRTKCRISAAEVPIYRFSSGRGCQCWAGGRGVGEQLTPELDASDADIVGLSVGGERYVREQLAQGVGASLDVGAGARAGRTR